MIRPTNNNLQFHSLNHNNIVTSEELEQEQKKDLIESLCSKFKQIDQNNNNWLQLDLGEVHKQKIHQTLQDRTIEDLKLLSSVTYNFFTYLQPSNERRHDVIKLFLCLPSSEWDNLQQQVSHYLGFNCCIDSLIKALSEIVKFNNKHSRHEIFKNAIKTVDFNTSAFDRVNILIDAAEKYLDSLKEIYILEYSPNIVKTIKEINFIKDHILSGKQYLLIEDMKVKKEVYQNKGSILDLL